MSRREAPRKKIPGVLTTQLTPYQQHWWLEYKDQLFAPDRSFTWIEGQHGVRLRRLLEKFVSVGLLEKCGENGFRVDETLARMLLSGGVTMPIDDLVRLE